LCGELNENIVDYINLVDLNLDHKSSSLNITLTWNSNLKGGVREF
jgi:hypothetical protein